MRFKALEEWTEEVGLGKRQPEVRGQRRGGGWGGDLALHSQMSPNVTTISWARAAPSHPAGVQGSPWIFHQCKPHLGPTFTTPSSSGTGPAAVTQTST